MNPLSLVNLTPLMNLTAGKPSIKIGLIDGPVATNHPDFIDTPIQVISRQPYGTCSRTNSIARNHGTFVAGVLSAGRQSIAPAISPACTLIVRSIFSETTVESSHMPTADPQELATAILECINAGAHILNLSLDLSPTSGIGQRTLDEALNYASQQSVIIVAAAGNQATIRSSVITRHPWVVPIVACDLRGQPAGQSNLASSIGKRGLRAPGDTITSIGSNGRPLIFSGTSAAVPFVTGTTALLWTQFPTATATQVRFAITQAYTRRHSLVPPLLNAWAAFQFMRKEYGIRSTRIKVKGALTT